MKKETIFLFISVFIIGKIECEELICPINNNNTFYRTLSQENLLQTLFELCHDDILCANIYHQSDRKNITVFRHLLSNNFILENNNNNLFFPVQNLLCNGYNVDYINNKLWLMHLIINREKSQPQCDVNHHLIFDELGLKSHCACKSDRVCSDGLYDLTPFYVLIAVAGLFSLIIIIANFYKIIKILQGLNHVTTKYPSGNDAGARALNNLLS